MKSLDEGVCTAAVTLEIWISMLGKGSGPSLVSWDTPTIINVLCPCLLRPEELPDVSVCPFKNLALSHQNT